MTDWMNMENVPFQALLLLEREQINWLPGWHYQGHEHDFAIALRANPDVEWYLRHKCPQVAPWLDELMADAPQSLPAPVEVRAAELIILKRFDDLLVYALDPAIYDTQPFLRWDSCELTDLVDLRGKRVIDVGAGTGRLASVALQQQAATVYAVEPVENLRHYMRRKFASHHAGRFFAVDGLITAIPFESAFAEVVMGGHVFGDEPQAELAELERVAKPGGMVILLPATNDEDSPLFQFLVDNGYAWARFEEPGDGFKRKYWKTVR